MIRKLEPQLYKSKNVNKVCHLEAKSLLGLNIYFRISPTEQKISVPLWYMELERTRFFIAAVHAFLLFMTVSRALF